MHLKNVPLSPVIWPNSLPPPQANPLPGAIFLKIELLHPWVRRKAPTENEVDWLNTF